MSLLYDFFGHSVYQLDLARAG